MCDGANPGGDSPDASTRRDANKLPDDGSLSDSDPEDPSLPFDPEVEDLSSSSADDEPADLELALPSVRPEPAFSLKGGSSSFSNKSRSIFDCLEKAAGLGPERLTALGPERPTALGPERPTALGPERPAGPCLKERLVGPPPSQDRAPGLGPEERLRDGVFARPSPPPALACRGGKRGRGGGVPDYLLHPERWTRYSLEDVAETSERQNSQLAHQFIAGLQQRRSAEARAADEPFHPTFNQSSNSSSQHKIVFSRPGRGQGGEAGAEEASGGGGGRRMALRQPDLEEEDEDEEEDTLVLPPRTLKEGERKRKHGEVEEERGRPEEEGEEGEQEKSNLSFSNFRKVNRKNFRRSTKTEED